MSQIRRLPRWLLWLLFGVWYLVVKVSPGKGVTSLWRNGMIQVQMVVGQSFSINVVPIPSDGVLDSPPSYVTQVGNLGTLAPAADGLSAKYTASAAGVETISVKGLSLGVSIAGDDTVQVTITAPPVQATALHVSVTQPA